MPDERGSLKRTVILISDAVLICCANLAISQRIGLWSLSLRPALLLVPDSGSGETHQPKTQNQSPRTKFLLQKFLVLPAGFGPGFNSELLFQQAF
jgi:hypothetical protein